MATQGYWNVHFDLHFYTSLWFEVCNGQILKYWMFRKGAWQLGYCLFVTVSVSQSHGQHDTRREIYVGCRWHMILYVTRGFPHKHTVCSRWLRQWCGRLYHKWVTYTNVSSIRDRLCGVISKRWICRWHTIAIQCSIAVATVDSLSSIGCATSHWGLVHCYWRLRVCLLIQLPTLWQIWRVTLTTHSVTTLCLRVCNVDGINCSHRLHGPFWSGWCVPIMMLMAGIGSWTWSPFMENLMV